MALSAVSASPLSLSRKPAAAAVPVVFGMMTVMMMVMVMGAQAATQHEVGGTPGWSLPSRVNVNYTDWAASQKFVVGDTLLFSYNSTFHNVVEVSKTDYDNCNSSNPIHTWSDGKTVVNLDSAGTLYFFCSVPTHCTQGQKVAVTVLSSSSASAPSSSSSPSSAMPSLTLPPSATLIITLTAVLSLTIALL